MLKSFGPVENGVDKAAIKKDVAALRLSYDSNIFGIGSKLFLDKWRAVCPEFTQYFENTWLKQNSQWYNGTVFRMVSTNNGMENLNLIFKRFHTHMCSNIGNRPD